MGPRHESGAPGRDAGVQWCEKQLGQESLSARAEEGLDCVCKAGGCHAQWQGGWGSDRAQEQAEPKSCLPEGLRGSLGLVGGDWCFLELKTPQCKVGGG